MQFNQAITSTDITADQIQIGVDAANEISTTSGNLVLDSDGGTVNVTDDLDVDNNLNVFGNAKVDGTFTVDGIKCALKSGFKKVYSCDINSEFVEKAMYERKNVNT